LKNIFKKNVFLKALFKKQSNLSDCFASLHSLLFFVSNFKLARAGALTADPHNLSYHSSHTLFLDIFGVGAVMPKTLKGTNKRKTGQKNSLLFVWT
jgi:hypothetical protein